MGMKVGGNNGGPMADINVTPLVDVMLVLLIIFMVITPMLSSGIDVQLPAAKSAHEAKDNGQHLVISIRDDAAIFVDTKRSSEDTLIEDVNEAYQADPDRGILIKGDKILAWSDVHGVMSIIQEGGMTTMLLATEQGED
jgi:biopolymer transport protein TolR